MTAKVPRGNKRRESSHSFDRDKTAAAMHGGAVFEVRGRAAGVQSHACRLCLSTDTEHGSVCRA